MAGVRQRGQRERLSRTGPPPADAHRAVRLPLFGAAAGADGGGGSGDAAAPPPVSCEAAAAPAEMQTTKRTINH